MAEENGNGRGNGKDPVVEAIHELTGEVRTVNTRLESVEQVLRGHGRQLGEVVERLDRVEGVAGEVVERLDRVETGLADLRGEVHEGFAGLGQKLDSATARDRRLEDGLQQLGERVARLEGRDPESR
jgi:ABC-type transporter Mla subunit MlaD